MTASATSLSFVTVSSGQDDRVAFLSLARPDSANAFNDAVIKELVAHLEGLRKAPKLRAVVLRGEGKHFSAGADLSWMKASAKLSYDENLSDARGLIALFEAVATMPVPTVAAVHGAAYGGAVGLAAACDVAIAAESARFSLSEVKLGLMPAVILPYLMRKMRAGGLRRAALTGRPFSAAEAREMGLVERVVPDADLDLAVREELDLILQGSPEAQAKLKILMQELEADDLRQSPRTAEAIAKLRTGPLAQAGLASFFEKKSPPWTAKL